MPVMQKMLLVQVGLAILSTLTGAAADSLKNRSPAAYEQYFSTYFMTVVLSTCFLAVGALCVASVLTKRDVRSLKSNILYSSAIWAIMAYVLWITVLVGNPSH